LRLLSYGGYGLALAALALMVFGAFECPPLTRRVSSGLNDSALTQRTLRPEKRVIFAKMCVIQHSPRNLGFFWKLLYFQDLVTLFKRIIVSSPEYRLLFIQCKTNAAYFSAAAL